MRSGACIRSRVAGALLAAARREVGQARGVARVDVGLLLAPHHAVLHVHVEGAGAEAVGAQMRAANDAVPAPRGPPEIADAFVARSGGGDRGVGRGRRDALGNERSQRERDAADGAGGQQLPARQFRHGTTPRRRGARRRRACRGRSDSARSARSSSAGGRSRRRAAVTLKGLGARYWWLVPPRNWKGSQAWKMCSLGGPDRAGAASRAPRSCRVVPDAHQVVVGDAARARVARRSRRRPARRAGAAASARGRATSRGCSSACARRSA